MEQIIGGIVITVILIFALREVYCWYGKINRSIELQEEMAGTLKRILEHLRKDENSNAH